MTPADGQPISDLDARKHFEYWHGQLSVATNVSEFVPECPNPKDLEFFSEKRDILQPVYERIFWL
jgi:hypothetical protein